MIFWIRFSLKFKDEVIVQPFTSKVSRIVVSNYPSYVKISESNEPLKPVRVTVIRDEEGRSIFKSMGYKILKLKAGVNYYFDLTSLDINLFEEVVSNPYFNVKVYSTEASVEVRETKVFEEPEIEDSKAYRIEFKTPTLIQPPRPNFKRKKNRYLLFPFSPYFLVSIQRHWNKYQEKKIIISHSRALYYFKEVDYNLRPVTIIYDKSKVRGFVGWALFTLEARRNSSLRDGIRKLLAYANYVGVGKSRAIGFGEVMVKSIKN
ncbi:CRISPR-associated endoribonuclease Cas6 [Sulfolobus sp. S-194]|uniref:CRISPR-associated endoribonuclease Cas6 n=1 Tax=Sulfolobus sp. S-194 TaxID=2512240 RepID=UPI0014390738|nr:CRISPR-associated endoribonuclease Cas6 [Sulfolobus sp. S-194]